MTLAHFLNSCVAATAVFGCVELLADTQQTVDSVDFTRTANDREVRVILSSAGAARIDIKRASDCGSSLRTILVPLRDPTKVVRTAKTIAALIDASVDVRKAQWAGFFSDDQLVIRCHLARDNKMRTIRMGQNDLTVDPVWKGVVEEIDIVALVQLAAAIDAAERGRSQLAKGEREQSLAAYQCAVTTFEEWQQAEVLRFGGPTATYEPEVTIKLEYPRREQGDWVVVSGVPRNVMELPGISLDWAVKLLQQGWHKHCESSHLTVSESDGLFIVAWKEWRTRGKEQRIFDPGLSIPSSVVDALRKLQ